MGHIFLLSPPPHTHISLAEAPQAVQLLPIASLLPQSLLSHLGTSLSLADVLNSTRCLSPSQEPFLAVPHPSCCLWRRAGQTNSPSLPFDGNHRTPDWFGLKGPKFTSSPPPARGTFRHPRLLHTLSSLGHLQGCWLCSRDFCFNLPKVQTRAELGEVFLLKSSGRKLPGSSHDVHKPRQQLCALSTSQPLFSFQTIFK